MKHKVALTAILCAERGQRRGALRGRMVGTCDPAKANPANTSTAMATIFITMSALWVRPPLLTPRQLISVRMRRHARRTAAYSGVPSTRGIAHREHPLDVTRAQMFV